MEFFYINSMRSLDEFCEKIRQVRLPIKVVIQESYPGRSIDMNAYYWGIVLKYIAESSGHTQEECHEQYKRMFNFRWDIEYNRKTKMYEMSYGIKSTTGLDSKEFWDYIFRVRVHGEIEHGILIPLPSELMIPELNFEFENKNEMRRI